jgi:hypothetical protein
MILLPDYLSEGVFCDGLNYSAVAQDLARGENGFWSLQLSETYNAKFLDQLPMFIWVQSLFFRVFGDSFYTEGIMASCLVILNVLLMRRLWKHFFSGSRIADKYAWMPVLFWACIPEAMWVYSNNMIEMLMGFFVLAAVAVIAPSLREGNLKIAPLVLGGVLIWCAAFCKGPQGVFPIITIAAYYIVWPERISFRKAVLGSLIITAIPVAITAVVLLFEPARDYTNSWFGYRVVHSFSETNTRGLQPHYNLAWRLFSELIPCYILMTLLAVSVGVRKQWRQINSRGRNHWFFLLIGLSGSLPLLLTSEQRGFYLGTSLSFFALGLASWSAPMFLVLFGNVKISARAANMWKVGALIAVIGAVSFASTRLGTYSRDEKVFADSHLLGTYLGRGTMAGVVFKGSRENSFQAHIARYYDIDLDLVIEDKEYIITPISYTLHDDAYELVDLKMNQHRLYHCIGCRPQG